MKRIARIKKISRSVTAFALTAAMVAALPFAGVFAAEDQAEFTAPLQDKAGKGYDGAPLQDEAWTGYTAALQQDEAGTGYTAALQQDETEEGYEAAAQNGAETGGERAGSENVTGRRIRGLRPAQERVVHHDTGMGDALLGGVDISESRYVSPYMTEINNQGDTGCCWAVGATSALEANLKKKYGDDFDFSWKNLAYHAYHKNDVSNNPDADDYTELIYRQDSFNAGPREEEDYYHGYRKTGAAQDEGGTFVSSDEKDDSAQDEDGAFVLSDEKDGAAYDGEDISGPDNDKTGAVPREDIDQNLHYGRNDSGYINCVENNTAYLFFGGSEYTASLLYTANRCLRPETGDDTFSVGPVGLIDGGFGNAGKAGASSSDGYRVSDIHVVSAARTNMDNIKAMIKQYGGGDISYDSEEENAYAYCSDSYVSQIVQEYGEEYVANHVVTIVGWDDTISASNFTSPSPEGGYGRYAQGDDRPAGDGAWICLNSWGNNESTDNGKTYISYYDASLNYCDIRFYDLFKKGDESGAWLWTDNTFAAEAYDRPQAATDSKARGLTMKADEDLTLTSVNVFVAEDGASYTLYVYGNPVVSGKAVSMTGNTPLTTKSVRFETAGFHRILLDKPVGIGKGQTVMVVLKPDKSIKNFYSKQQTVEEDAEWDENLYLGHYYGVSKSSGLSVIEQDNGLVKMKDGDVYLRLYSNDGIAAGAITFEGSDFNPDAMDTVDVSDSKDDDGGKTDPGLVMGKSYAFESGSDRYEITWTDSVPYTGCPHVAYGSGKNGATPDVQVAVKKNGQTLDAGLYKLKFKDNRFVNGYKPGKSPHFYVKLHKSCGKDAQKALKSVPLGFEIRKCDVSSDLDYTYFDIATNNYMDRVVRLYDICDRVTGRPVKLKLSRDGYKGDLKAELRESGRNELQVVLTGINNCTGTHTESFELDMGWDW